MRALILVVVLILAVAGIWLASGTEVAPPREEGSQPSLDPAVAAAMAAAGPTEEEATEREAVDVAHAGETDDDQVFYNVRVVRGEDREPVPGALVGWIPPGFEYEALSEEEQQSRFDDRAAFTFRHGESATADDTGRAVIRGPWDGLGIYGRSGEWFGQATLRARDPQTRERVDPDPEYPLELQRDQTLVVRAVDGSGNPVPDVSVWLHRTFLVDGEASERASPFRTPTDAGGLTRWPHAQSLVVAGQELQSASVVPALFGGNGDPVPLDLLQLPDEPLDVRVPAFGSIEVCFSDPMAGRGPVRTCGWRSRTSRARCPYRSWGRTAAPSCTRSCADGSIKSASSWARRSRPGWKGPGSKESAFARSCAWNRTCPSSPAGSWMGIVSRSRGPSSCSSTTGVE